MKTAHWALPAVVIAGLVAAGCATAPREMQPVTANDLAIIKASFQEKGQAKLDRLDQDEAQKLCSHPPSIRMPREVSARIEKNNMATIKYPADGNLMGDWKAGERIAQTGVGKQFSDNPKTPSGGNCYA